jgi:hypothetical protein
VLDVDGGDVPATHQAGELNDVLADALLTARA